MPPPPIQEEEELPVEFERTVCLLHMLLWAYQNVPSGEVNHLEMTIFSFLEGVVILRFKDGVFERIREILKMLITLALRCGSPDKLREVVLKFNEQNALDEMILAPERNNFII